MTRRSILTGSVALMILMGTLLFVSPAHAVIQNCDSYTPGTQAYAECMVRAEDRESAPILPPSEQQQIQPRTTVVETTSTDVWQLALAGLAGALVALGGTMAVVRFAQRGRVTATR